MKYKITHHIRLIGCGLNKRCYCYSNDGKREEVWAYTLSDARMYYIDNGQTLLPF